MAAGAGPPRAELPSPQNPHGAAPWGPGAMGQYLQQSHPAGLLVPPALHQLLCSPTHVEVM